MPAIIATNSCHRQQLIRADDMRNLQPMVANTKQDFAARLNEACDTANHPIVSGRGRRAELRARVEIAGLKLSGESVRKWLSAESIPAMDSIRFISVALGVNADWLLTGRGDKYPAPRRQTNRLEANQTSPDYLSAPQPVSAAFSSDEKTVIDGFRHASTRDREMMIFIANRALEDFDKRSEQI